jgi:hypothetical protein
MVLFILYLSCFHFDERHKLCHRLQAWRMVGSTNSVPPAHCVGDIDCGVHPSDSSSLEQRLGRTEACNPRSDSDLELDRGSVLPSTALPEIRIHSPSEAHMPQRGGCGLRTRGACHDHVRPELYGMETIPEIVAEGEDVENARLAFSVQSGDSWFRSPTPTPRVKPPRLFD